MLNSNAVSTLRSHFDRAIDQDHRQITRFRDNRRTFELIEAKRHDPEAILTLCRQGTDVAKDGEHDERAENAANLEAFEAAESLMRRAAQ